MITAMTFRSCHARSSSVPNRLNRREDRDRDREIEIYCLMNTRWGRPHVRIRRIPCLALTRTSFRSTQAKSGRSRILPKYGPSYAATFAWQRSTLRSEGLANRAVFKKFRSHAFHSWDGVASGFELILGEALTAQDGRFGDGRQPDVVVWS